MITLVERETNKGYAVNIYVNGNFSLVAFSAVSFRNAKRTALHTIKNSRTLSEITVLG